MARKVEAMEIEVGDETKTISIKELKVKELKRIYGHFEKGFKISELREKMDTIFEIAAPGLSTDMVDELTPGEIEAIWERFKKLNSPFFRGIDMIGGKELLAGIKDQIKLNYWRAVADSQRPASDQ